MSSRADVKVGFACNNRCVFCAQGSKREDVGLVEPRELLRRLTEARGPRSEPRGLVLTGGEPTIRKDLAQVVRVARTLGYGPIQVQTNGRMLSYPGWVSRLRAAGVDEISPALHGPRAEVHDRLVRAEGAFAETVRGIENALASGATVITNTVVQRGNLTELAATIEVLGDLGVREAQLAMVHPVGTAAELFEEVVPDLADAARYVHDALRAGRSRGMRVVVEAMPLCFMREHEDAVIEEAIPETTVVDLDGEAFAFSDWRRSDGKAKGPPCIRCSRAGRCEGPWREYPEWFGWSRYQPFTDGT